MSQPRILIVEDHPFQRNVLLKLAQKCGEVADNVRSCKEAVASLTANDHYKLIIMDWQLADPDEDGLECTRQIRKLDVAYGKHTFIVGLTGNAQPGDREKCLEAGMDDYYTKPVTAEQFEQIVHRYLNEPATT